jgi:16S rRNA A1518/A1519 N6-dimethyltransferase RsmA/KsgA/DIM1 with predicted DNA glycosylase/AP lyase activity
MSTLSWSAKSAICASSAPERSIQFVPSVLAGFADLMGFQRHLLDDQIRTGALIQAINAIVKPGDSVIDLGTGTGILAMAAARAGAARVYALEHNSMVSSAQALARENGLATKIEFHQIDSHDFCLAEKADVIISECFGLLGVGGTMFRIHLRVSRAIGNKQFVFGNFRRVGFPGGGSRGRQR